MSDQEKKIPFFAETLSLSVTEMGRGQHYLVLHGGAGPASVAALAERLSQKGRVVVPILPGFSGRSRPDWFRRVDDVVTAYLALIERLDLSKVVVVGNSFGGWVAAEMALRHSKRVAGIVLLNAVGIDTGSADKVIADPMKVPPEERTALSFHDPRKSFGNPSPEQLAVMAENQKTLRVFAGEPFMHDPSLLGRLKGFSVPTLVAWGESDRIVDVDYGRRWTAGIPGARFHLVPEAGHFPQIEQKEAIARLVEEFAAGL